MRKIFFAGNKIAKIENLESQTELTMLELGANRIRKIENLEKNTKLAEIFLGKNKIVTVENLAHLRYFILYSLLESMKKMYCKVLIFFM